MPFWQEKTLFPISTLSKGEITGKTVLKNSGHALGGISGNLIDTYVIIKAEMGENAH